MNECKRHYEPLPPTKIVGHKETWFLNTEL